MSVGIKLVLSVALGALLAMGIIGLLEYGFSKAASAGRASVADIVCVSGGVPIIRAGAAENVVEHDNGRLSWTDSQAAYSTNADCVVRRQKP